MPHETNRRGFLAATSAAAVAGNSFATAAPAPRSVAEGFTYCLNMSTIREQTTDIVKQISIAEKAGYEGIEPWIPHLEQYTKAGGSLSDLRKQISDAGLTVESAIGFANWISNDEQQRTKGLETAKRDMDMVAQIGGTRIAAPPVGAHRNSDKIDTFVIAERYRKLLELGDTTGVVPQLEVWGFSDNLSRLGESVMACVEASHPKACLLPDVYHIFKGGSDFGGLALLHDNAVQVFHT